MSVPTLINLPPPPSDPATPSDMGPGTPNSTTTSLSALSTTAIKDGHQGHLPAHARRDSNTSDASQTTLDAERADRISRLAGLERVSTVRASSTNAPGGGAGGPTSHGHGGAQQIGPGYFDNALPAHIRERSTVGSASATGSVGGRTQTTWASTSTSDVLSDHGGDKMSEDNLHTSMMHGDGGGIGTTTDAETEMMMDRDEVSSTGGFSDEGNASLVGFGEGAGSTISGPISTAALAARFAGSTGNAFNTTGGFAGGGGPGGSTRGNSSIGSPTLSKAAIANLQQQQQGLTPQWQSHLGSYTPMSGVSATGATYEGDQGGLSRGSGSVTPERADPRMLDGMSYDRDVVDTTVPGRRGRGKDEDEDE